jgi:myo-inositol 2-dehydrogenase/D-chiro-inositol 1-dehydrogenase
VLTEIGVHHYDLWRFLLDSEVEEVFAMSVRDDGAATVSARMTSGTLATAAFSEVTGGRNEVDLFGQAGQLHLSCYRFDGLEVADIQERYPGSVRSRLRRTQRLLRDLPEISRAIRRGGDFIDSYRAEWADFLAGVKSGRASGPSLLDGRRALEVALAAVESVSTGQPVACAAAPRTFAAHTPAGRR